LFKAKRLSCRSPERMRDSASAGFRGRFSVLSAISFRHLNPLAYE